MGIVVSNDYFGEQAQLIFWVKPVVPPLSFKEVVEKPYTAPFTSGGMTGRLGIFPKMVVCLKFSKNH